MCWRDTVLLLKGKHHGHSSVFHRIYCALLYSDVRQTDFFEKWRISRHLCIAESLAGEGGNHLRLLRQDT